MNLNSRRRLSFMKPSIILAVTLAVGALTPAWAHGPEPHAKAPTKPGHAEALGEPGNPKGPARTIRVVMNDEFRFVPDRVAIRAGETIRFELRNIGGQKHEMVLGTMDELQEHALEMQKFPEMEHDDPNAASAEGGKSAVLVWKFTKPGKFYFGCLVPGHFEAGMKGEIVVSDKKVGG
jgi:uncharacterized cupredoxin-like copper-binding protein